MEKINKLLQSEKAWIIAFIPVLNIIYLFFWLLTYKGAKAGERPKKTVLLLVATYIVIAAAAILDGYVNSEWYMIPISLYGYEALFAFAFIKTGKGSYEFRTLSRILLIIIVPIVTFVIAIFVWAGFEQANYSDICTNAVEALVEEDTEEWQKALHPNAYDSLGDIKEIKAILSEDDIFIDDELVVKKRYDFTNSIVDGETHKKFIYSLSSGRPIYNIRVVYTINGDGSGITEITVKKANFLGK